MNFIFTYLLEVIFISGIFWLGFLLIRKHTTPSFRRLYLLGWMIFSSLFPVISVSTPQSPNIKVKEITAEMIDPSWSQDGDEINKPQDLLDSKVSIESDIKSESEFNNSNWKLIVGIIYLGITLFFLGRLSLGIFQVFKLKRGSDTQVGDGQVCFIVKEAELKGASFFNWIFVGKDVDDFDMILNHELTHVRLFHSLDILLSHIYCCLFWINPFAWPLKRIISLNTELETDYFITRQESYSGYANALLGLSVPERDVSIMNHFSARHLKARIIAMKSIPVHRRWVSVFTTLTILLAFWLVSCDIEQPSDVIMAERLQNVKTITTRFTSHQDDTQQKTGKIVAITSFLPDGTLDEFVEQTTYPYDREFETKKYFWDAPDKSGLPYIMDGLTTGTAEKTFLYGNDWPIAYAKFLKERSIKEEGDFPWREIVSVDDETLPTEIERKQEKKDESSFIEMMMPDVTEYFEYENGKVINVMQANFYRNIDDADEAQKKLRALVEKDMSEEEKEIREQTRKQSGEKFLTTEYSYEGDNMTSVKNGDYERRYFYENNLLVRSEYYKSGTLLNSRVHYYEDGLKDRTEIFNRYNEAEYTITYEYEFW